MRKIVQVALLALLLASVTMIGTCVNAEAASISTMAIEKSPCELGKGTFFVPRITGLSRTELQEQLNHNVKAAILNWAEAGASLNGDFEVSYNNGKLLGIHFIGYSMFPGAAHPNKIDKGLHVDLTSGMVYQLADLFIPGVDYQSKIMELCENNKEAYRLQIPGLFDGWKHADFTGSWSGSDASFLLNASAIRVYSIPRYVTGALSGYAVPYADLMDIINQDGALWKSLQFGGSHE